MNLKQITEKLKDLSIYHAETLQDMINRKNHRKTLRLLYSLLGIVCLVFLILRISNRAYEVPEKTQSSIKSVEVVTADSIAENKKPKVQKPSTKPYIKDKADEFVSYKAYVTETVKLRKSNSTNSSQLASLNTNEVLTVEGKDSGWVKVRFKDKIGWVKEEYLREYKEDSYIDDLGDISFNHQDFIEDCIKTFELDIDNYFVYGLIYVESRFTAKVTSSGNAKGLMQIVPTTWNHMYNSLTERYPEFSKKCVKNEPYDINSNLAVGIYTLKVIAEGCKVSSINKNQSQILTSYNRGIGGARTYFRSTGSYSSPYSEKAITMANYIRKNKRWRE